MSYHIKTPLSTVNLGRMALHLTFQLPIADVIGVFVQLSLKMGENRTDSVKDGLALSQREKE
jgi:hypothetical protein